MAKSYIINCDLIRLHNILDSMINQKRITLVEAEDILKKAGLIKINDTQYKTEYGYIFTF